MKASETSLRNLLEGGKQFQIPLFQRPYSWKKENWETLWEDLISLYNDDEKGFYFLGPIVTQAELGTADGISRYIVIDGQQRFTTLSILLAALRNYLKKSDKQIAEQIHEFFLINKYQKNDDFYKVLPTQDDCDAYKSIIDNKIPKAKNKESQSGAIHEAYKFFDGKLKKPFVDEDVLLDFAKFKNIILERLVLVNITSDNNDNPYLIFESLNNKGEELTQADLVRNYIFMKLPSEERDEVYNNEWLPLQESFKLNMKQKEYAEELTKAFWFYLRKDGEAVNEKAVYKSIKQRFDESAKRFEKPELGIKAELHNLIKFTNYYLRLNFDEEEQEPKLKYWFQRLKKLDFTTCHIFLLNIYYEYESQRLSIQDFEKILQYLESYFVRRWIVGIPTRALGTIFNNLYKQVKQKNPEDLVNGLRQVLISFEKTQVFPDDNLFYQHIINEPLYNNKSSAANERVKFLLESIEQSLSKERVDTLPMSLEHIMPQKSPLRKEWQEMLGADYNKVHKELLHTLGNLTLTQYNSELSNKSFEEKLKILRASNVTLNQYFRKVDVWNEQEIKSRAEYLANIAIKVWPR
ncbi:DUF262 domain-containing protein [Nostoc sp. 'Lobaria pulmonaria (5183) cyanobiont']|uniref:DUF262 domain-containing protein n=1 Tax=Nostoc sp. 'Lobaria pulmonaria (5183) cyanobiont' TaxID=1618022 RepID=UPI000CF34384|nr:DUF262 domain-containing protein [Nostoc sp. 'Lobaria pulmonaria (5183) cyanobiont']AVH74221.1 hypothetical protein NLP_5981 [Nostoc sp. 'Lobaria pulmonaria (5183) cyanobiont']